MEHLHELDKEFLDEIYKKAKNDSDIQLLLGMVAELNGAISEQRPVKENYLPMLGMLLAARGMIELDVIRFVSRVAQHQPE